MKKYTFKDDFEMLVVRHDYLSKVKNADPKWINEWKSTVEITSSIMYKKLKPNFEKVGYDLDDIVSIANCYMVGYMGLYSIERNNKVQVKFEDFFIKKENRKPTIEETKNKERVNLISFLRQRLQHASVLCSRKARNITVGRDIRAAYAVTKDSVKASEELILEDHKKLGYRKVDIKELKDIKLNARIKRIKELKDKDGFDIIEIQHLNNGIDFKDYYNLFISDHEDSFHINPEDSYILKENSVALSSFTKKFNNLTTKQKRKKLKEFILKFKDNISYKEELAVARKMIRTKDFVV